MTQEAKGRIKSIYEDMTIKSIFGNMKDGTAWTAKKVWDFSPRTVWEGLSSAAITAKNAVTPIRKQKPIQTIDLSHLADITPEELMAFIQDQMNTSVVIVSKETGEVIDMVQDAEFISVEETKSKKKRSSKKKSTTQK